LGAWALAWAASPFKNAGAWRFENQGLFVAACIVAAALPADDRNRQAGVWCLCALALGGTAFVAMGRPQALGGLLAPQSSGRLAATFGNPLYFAGFCLLTLQMTWALLGRFKLGIWPVVFLAAIGGMSGSRAYMLVTLFFFTPLWLLSLWQQPRPDRSSWLSRALLTAVMAVVAVATARQVDWARATLRLPLWEQTVDHWLTRPWLGSGPGSFAVAFQVAGEGPLAEALASSGQYAEHPHNWVLFLLSEGGVVLLLAFLFLLFTIFKASWRAWTSQGPAMDRLALAAALGAIALLIENLVDRTLEVPGVAFFFWICLGWAFAGARPALSLNAGGRILAAALGLGLLVVGVEPLWTARQASAETGGGADVDPGADLALRAHLREQPGDAAGWESLGASLAGQLRYGEAAEAYAQALALDPQSRSAAANLGNSRLMSSDFKGAEAAFRRALRLRPRYAEGHFSLGAALFYQRRLKEAVAELDRCLEMEPGHARARQLKSRILQ
jgi:tetratricopeptide (TPR) repeat protein